MLVSLSDTFRIAAGLLLVSGPATVARGQPAFSKSFTPESIGPGSTSILELRIDNSASATPVDGLGFIDILPAGLGIATPAGLATTCVAGNLTEGSGTIAFANGRLGGFSVCTVTFWAVGTATATNVSGDLTSSAGNSGAATATLAVETDRPGFSASFVPPLIPLDGTSTLTWTVDNSANSVEAQGLSFRDISDVLPLGMRIATPANAVTDCPIMVDAPSGGRNVMIYPTTGTLAAGAICTFSVDVVGKAAGPIDYLSRELMAGALTVGRATALLEVERRELHKLFVGDPVPAGRTVEAHYTLTNLNRADTATDIAFTDDFDGALTGLAFTSLLTNSCGGTVAGAGTSLLDFSGGALAPGESCTITATITVPQGAASGTYASATSDVAFQVGGQGRTWDSATDWLLVQPVPLLTKDFLTDPVGPGGTATVRFEITNTSATSDAVEIAFTDELTTFLPMPLSLTLPPVPNPPCGVDSSVNRVSMGIDRMGLGLAGGSLAAEGSCSFDIGVEFPVGLAGGTKTNVTSAISASVDGTRVEGFPATDTVEVAYSPRLHKEFTNDPVLPGGTVNLRYTLSYPDVATDNATGIMFTDDLAALSPAMRDLGATGLPITGLCNSGTMTDSNGGTLLTFASGALAPGETCVVDVTLSVPAGAAPGAHTSSTSDLTAMVAGLIVQSPAATDDLDIAGLSLGKEFTDDPAYPGGTTTLRFILRNDHPTETATDIYFTDDVDSVLPGGIALTIESLSTPDPTACGASASLTASTPRLVQFSGGEMAPQSSCVLDAVLAVPEVAPGVYVNVTSQVSSSMGISKAASDALTIADPLLLTKTFLDDPVMPGATVDLEFAIANSHPVETATGIAFTDDLNAVLPGLVATDLPATGCGGVIDGTTSLTFSGGSLEPSSHCTFTVTLQIPAEASAASSFANVTSAVSATMSPSNVSVTGAAAIADLQVAFFSFAKTFARPVIAGGTATLTFTIENLDTAEPGSNIAFTDDFDAMLAGAAAVGLPAADVCGPGSKLDGTSVLTLRGAHLRAGGTCTFSANVLVPDGAAFAAYGNTTGSLTAGGLVIAEPASATLTVEPTPGFSKLFVPSLQGLGQPATLTFTIDNTASDLPVILEFTDNLPAGMTIHSVATPPSCTGGTLTAEVGADVLSYAGGAVGAGSTCAVHVEVVTAALGDYVNTSEPLVANGVTTHLTATATLTVVPPPVFAKAFAPTTISVGDVSTLTFSIDNTGSSLAVTDLAFADPLPTGMVVASPANQSVTCAEGTLAATTGEATIAYNGGALDPGATCEVAVDVTSDTAGVFANTSGELTSSAGNSGAATASLTVEELRRPSTPPDEGCGCSSRRGPGAWWLGWLAIAVLRGVRRCPPNRSRRLDLPCDPQRRRFTSP